MGASAKTLSRLVSLHQRGLLRDGAAIIELGAQELHCGGMEDYVRQAIVYFSERNGALKKPELYSTAEICQLADRGMFGRTLNACGFTYRALDIFEAENTTVFDLNIDEPAEELRQRFDLVTNLGTTEHVINQYQSMKTMHELAKSGGLMYHDLPLSGYHEHGYFSYNPLLFYQLAQANGYNIILQHYSKGTATPAPHHMMENGYPDSQYVDYGIEFIFQKTSDATFRLPLETSTSLGVSAGLCGDTRPYADVHLKAGVDALPWTHLLKGISGYELQRELLRRYARRLARLFKRG